MKEDNIIYNDITIPKYAMDNIIKECNKLILMAERMKMGGNEGVHRKSKTKKTE